MLFRFSSLIEVYSIDSPNKVHSFREVSNVNQSFLKLNPFIACNYTKYDIYLVSPILIVLLNTNCKQWGSVTNTKC